MKCLRIYATPDGESHFDEIELPTTKRSVHPDAVPFELVEDTHGEGHLSRHSAEAQTVIWISLPNGLDLPPA
jgi:hypothetical protein